VAQVPSAGDGWSHGRRRESGNASTRRCWPSYVVAASSTWRAPSSIVHPFARCLWGKNGPNPTNRRKRGSKHYLFVDAQGIPLAVILTAANRHDITQLDALVAAISHVRSKPGGTVNLLVDVRPNTQYLRIANLGGMALQHRSARHAFPRLEGLGA
jgi:Transposase DDE domain